MYSANEPTRALMALAIEMRVRHPNAPARDILDEVILAHRGEPLAFGVVLPNTPFGQLVAEAFDRGMEPSDWISLSKCPDRTLHVFLHQTWETEVWPKFLDAYPAKLKPLAGV